MRFYSVQRVPTFVEQTVCYKILQLDTNQKVHILVSERYPKLVDGIYSEPSLWKWLKRIEEYEVVELLDMDPAATQVLIIKQAA